MYRIVPVPQHEEAIRRSFGREWKLGIKVASLPPRVGTRELLAGSAFAAKHQSASKLQLGGALAGIGSNWLSRWPACPRELEHGELLAGSAFALFAVAKRQSAKPTIVGARRRSLDLPDASSAQDARQERAELRSILLNRLQHEGLLRTNESDLESVLEACLRFLARSQAEFLLVNLEDLWFETGPQNMPGTLDEHPNWRQKSALALESIRDDPRVLRLLSIVRQARAAGSDR